MLWKRLRVLRRDGLHFRRQHPVGPYILDFFCDAAKLAIEVDGVHHTTDDRISRDAQRDDWCSARGIETLRFPAPEVLNAPDGCVDRIVEVARGRMRVVNGRKSVRWRGAD
jgi:very-short-patch-repair endonuclease